MHDTTDASFHPCIRPRTCRLSIPCNIGPLSPLRGSYVMEIVVKICIMFPGSDVFAFIINGGVL